MKTKLATAFALLSLISCSKNEADPDLTQEFVGTWKTDIQKSSHEIVSSTYDFKRISNNLLRIEVAQKFESVQGDFDDYADRYVLDSARVSEDRFVKVKSSRILANGQTVSYDATGQINDDTLTVKIIVDYDNIGNNIPTTIKLTRP
ncbi:hypothetical protein GCM10007423_26980 [Dyadobacter endophyticus]|uniref:Lipocalin-like domain-containing protein n=1 Tax=Dyadobacter endophyticus TaxID=1749036 RepID=A0ABQ1YSU9_9BACT|nr:hypothetical protein [Dyadobacter endophyticus]GGH35388.1 hypothetical protein GCM10007423_26980 [Dyadobacter endophyticus]